MDWSRKRLVEHGLNKNIRCNIHFVHNTRHNSWDIICCVLIWWELWPLKDNIWPVPLSKKRFHSLALRQIIERNWDCFYLFCSGLTFFVRTKWHSISCLDFICVEHVFYWYVIKREREYWNIKCSCNFSQSRFFCEFGLWKWRGFRRRLGKNYFSGFAFKIFFCFVFLFNFNDVMKKTWIQ